MFSKFFDSLTYNFKQKTTNPFLGTLIIVWLFRNWDLIYALFYFDNSMNLEAKLDWINTYYQEKSFYLDLLYTVLESFLILAITYFLLNAARYIVNLYENRLSPWIYKISKPSGIVKYEDYLILDEKLSRADLKISEERRRREDAEEKAERLEKKIIEMSTEEKQEETKQAPNFTETFEKSLKKDDNDKELKELFKKINDSEYRKELPKVVETVSNKEDLDVLAKSTKYFSTIDIIERVGDEFNGYATYDFTEKGKRFKDFYVKNFY